MKINGKVNEVLKMPEVRERLRGAELIGGSPKEFAAFIDGEIAKWGKVVKASGAKVE